MSTSTFSKKFIGFFALVVMLFTTVQLVAQTTHLSPTVNNGGFESGATGWTIVNATGANKWQVSTGAVAGFSGTQSAYISNSTISPFAHAYTITSASVSHMYRDITIPAGESTITLTFKRVGLGESCCDYMRIWLCPTTFFPTANTQTTGTGTAPTGRVNTSGGTAGININNISATIWGQHATLTLPAAYAGTTFRLIFEWRNDASVGPTPPIAVDDVTLISSCSSATTAPASSITSSSASMNWNTFAGATGYNLQYRMVGAPSWTAAPGNPYAGLSASITGLSSSSNYEYQVSATGPVCNAWSPSATFTTLCASITSFPTILETFATYLPSTCWNEGDNGTLVLGPATVGDATISSWVNDGFGGVGTTGSARANLDASGDNDWIISPSYTLPATPNMQLRYRVSAANWAATTAVTNWEADDFVELLVSTSGLTNWTVLRTYNNTNVPSNTGQTDISALSAYAGQTVRFAFRAVEGAANGAADVEVYIDDFIIEAVPSCIAPFSPLSGTPTSAIAANLAWTAPGTPPSNGYQWEVRTSGLGGSGLTGLTASGNTGAGVVTASTNALAAQTTYTLYVRSDCGGSSFSTWAASGTFTTPCAPVATYPSTEPFTTYLPTTCWNEGLGGSPATGPTSQGGAAINDWIADGFGNVGSTGAAKYNIYTTGANDWLISPEYTLPVSPAHQVRYNVAATQWNATTAPTTAWEADDFVELLVSTAPYTSWTILKTYNSTNVPSNTGQIDQSVLSTYAGSTVRFAFRAVEGATDGGADIDFFVDDFTVEVAPTCFAPTSLSAVPTSATAANLSWTAPSLGTPVGYEWEIRTSGAGGSGATGLIEANSTVAPATTASTSVALTPGTTYNLYVRTFCGGTDYSSWAGPSTFVAPLPGDVCATAIDLNTLTSPYSGTTVGMANNYSMPCAANTAPDLVFYIDVPANNTLTIGQTVNAYDSRNWLGYGGACPGTTSIACYDDPDVQNSTWTNCTGTTQRVYWIQDGHLSGIGTFTLAWTLSSTCAAPTALVKNSSTTSSLNIGWTNNTCSTTWDVYYGLSPATAPTGATTPSMDNIATNPVNITGLSAGTTYDVWVRSDCGGGSTSTWTGPLAATTSYNPPPHDNCGGARVLTSCAPPNFTTGSELLGATQSLAAISCAGFTGTADDDVWYQFVADATTMYITCQGSADYDAVLEVRSGACNGNNIFCADNTLGGDFEDIVATGLVIGTTYYVRVYDYSIGGILPTSSVWVTAAPAGCWLGVNNINWSDAGNWSNAVVPNSCAANVIIPSGTAFAPTIGSASYTVGNANVANGVTITANSQKLSVCGNWTSGSGSGSTFNATGTGASLEFTGAGAQSMSGITNVNVLRKTGAGTTSLAAGAVVNVGQELILNAGNLTTTGGTLTLISTSTTQAANINDFGSNTGTLTGPVTAQRFVGGTVYQQHQMGSPISNAPFSAFGAAGAAGFVQPYNGCDELNSAPGSPYSTVYQWHESVPTSCILQGWQAKVSGTSTNGKGYSVYRNPGTTLSVTGTPNLLATYTSAVQANTGYLLPTNQTGPTYSFDGGWHLMSNPFPSGYTYQQESGYDANGYVYQPVGPFSGTYVPLTPGTVLAPFQGFMVHTSGSAPFSFVKANRALSGSTVFYQNSAAEALEIEVSGNGFMDKTQLSFNAQSTDQFDSNFDLRKMRSNLGQPTIFTGENSFPYAMNSKTSIDQTNSVGMGLIPGANGTFTFAVNGISSFDPTTYIYLEDKVTGTWQNLRDNNSYTFSMTTTQDVNRFVLHFTPKAEISAMDASCNANGQILIEQPGSANWQYAVAAGNGSTVGSGTLSSASPLTLSVPAGVYTVSLVDDNGYTVVKQVQVNGSSSIVASGSSSTQVAEVDEDITFTSTTANATTTTWNFGDGNSSNTAIATHNYAQAGTYTVTLTVSNTNGCSSTITQTVTVNNKTTVGIANINKANIRMWSAGNKVLVDFSKQKNVDAQIEIYNILGQQISNEKFDVAGVYSKEILDTEAAYVIVKAMNNGELMTKKLFVTSK